MSVRNELISGTVYMAVAKYSGLIVSLIISAILSRLLSPEEFGIVGAVTVFIIFFNILGDIGVGPAIIQRSNLTKTDLDEIFTLTICLGFFLATIFFISSPLIASFYKNDLIQPIAQILSLQILFSCIGIVPTNLCYKNKQFHVVALYTLIVQLISGTGSIIYAYYGGNVFALVLQSVSSAGLLTILFWWRSNLRLRVFTKQAIDKIFSFSVYQSVFNIVTYFSRNLDKILIGKYLGLNALGYYGKSYRLMMLPLQNVTYVITPILLPIFSNLQNSPMLIGQKYIKLIKLLGFIAFPLTAILFFTGGELTLIVFGNQWIPAIEPFKILSLSVGLQILGSTYPSIFQALDSTKRLFGTGCWCLFFMVLAFCIAIIWMKSISAVCIGFLFAQMANILQAYYQLAEVLGISSWKFYKCLIPSILCGLFCFFGLMVFVKILPINLNNWISLLLKCSFFGVFWIMYLYFFTPYNPFNILLKGLKRFKR